MAYSLQPQTAMDCRNDDNNGEVFLENFMNLYYTIVVSRTTSLVMGSTP